MNKRNERLSIWANALESGKFKKGRNQLKRGTTKLEYCCLGVACEIFPDHVTGHKGDIETAPNTLLTQKSLKWLHISASEQSKLALLNDGNDTLTPRPTFRTIARYIREVMIHGKNWEDVR